MWNKVPYTNFHEINLDRIIAEVKKDGEEIRSLQEYVDDQDSAISARVTTNANNIATLDHEVDTLNNNLDDRISTELQSQIDSGAVADIIGQQVHAQVPPFISENNTANVFPLNRLYGKKVLIATGQIGSPTIQEYTFTTQLINSIQSAGGTATLMSSASNNYTSLLASNLENHTGSDYDIILLVLPIGDWIESPQVLIGRLNQDTNTYNYQLRRIAQTINSKWRTASVYVIPPFFNRESQIPGDENENSYIPFPFYHHAVYVRASQAGWNFWDYQRMPYALRNGAFWNTTYPDQLSSQGAQVVANWIYQRLLSGWGSDPEGVCMELAPLFPNIEPYISGGATVGIQVWNNTILIRGTTVVASAASFNCPTYLNGAVENFSIYNTAPLLVFRGTSTANNIYHPTTNSSGTSVTPHTTHVFDL